MQHEHQLAHGTTSVLLEGEVCQLSKAARPISSIKVAGRQIQVLQVDELRYGRGKGRQLCGMQVQHLYVSRCLQEFRWKSRKGSPTKNSRLSETPKLLLCLQDLQAVRGVMSLM